MLFRSSHLVHDLVALDHAFEAEQPEGTWEDYYAAKLVASYS